MIKRIVLIVAVVAAMAGCAGVGAPGEAVGGGSGVSAALKYVHDDVHGVGCWFIVGTNGGGSIACLPDASYKQ